MSSEQRLGNSVGTIFTEIGDHENEFLHDNPANSADKGLVTLVRVSNESGGEDSKQHAVDSMDQETSPSLIPLSRTQDPGSSIAASSQSIIPHSQEYGLRSTDLNPRKGDLVVVHLRRIGRGRKRRSVTKSGIVKEVDSKGRVKTNTCPRKFRKVVEICIRHSTSMIPNDTQSQSEHSISQSY